MKLFLQLILPLDGNTSYYFHQEERVPLGLSEGNPHTIVKQLYSNKDVKKKKKY